MPKKSKGFGQRVETVSGNTYMTIQSASTSGSIIIYPQNATWGTHINSMADAFNLCRCTRLKITFNPTAGIGDCLIGVGIGEIDATITTQANVSQLEYSAINFNDCTVPTTLSVPRSYLLKGQVPWYKTTVSAADVQFVYQGRIYCASSGTGTVGIFVQYTWEFTDWAATGATPKLSIPKCLSGSPVDPESQPVLSDKWCKMDDWYDVSEEELAKAFKIIALAKRKSIAE